MDEEELQALTLNPTPEPTPPPPAPAPAPMLAPLPIPPPIAPIPAPPPSALLRTTRASSATGSDSDRESSAPPPSFADYEISDASRQARERQERAVQELLMKRRAFAMAVPTNDSAVRARLRRLGEPITLFGEREMERRDRLRNLMVKLEAEGHLDRILRAHDEEQAASATAQATEDEESFIQYPFYTEGSKELYEARVYIAKYSLPRAAARLERSKQRRDNPDEDVEAEAQYMVKQAGGFVLECSEIGDDRPLSGCSFSNDGTLLATSAWSGVTKVWSMPQVTKVATLKGHTERATDVVFSPIDYKLATASADKTAKLWSNDGSLLRSFDGHLDRLARVAFHPSGKYLGTASFDKTWRLWDVETGTELLLQEGHSRSVYAVCFHPDGSLAASCGLDALARVWDLRTGRSILAFEGHVKPVLGIDFSPNGYRLATGSEDNTCRVWDMRKRRSLFTIPAHSHLISQVKYEPQEGYFLATASFDTKAMVWSVYGQDFKPIKTLAGHEAKVTGLDISGDGQQIVTVSHDRTIKIWTSQYHENDKPMDVD